MTLHASSISALASATARPSCEGSHHLTPEEDVIADPEDIDDEIDDTLPADLWF